MAALELVHLLHDRLSITVMLFMVAVGAWGLVMYLRGGAMTPSFAGALAIGEAVVVLQVLAGAVLLAAGAPRPGAIHYLYGITAVLVLPFAWSNLRERDQRRALLVYSLLALFIFGLAVRGAITAH